MSVSPGGSARPTCGVCGRSYKSQVYLRRHEQVHEGATRCPACRQVYSSVSNLANHMRVVHGLPLPRGRTIRGRRQLARERMMNALSGGSGGGAPGGGAQQAEEEDPDVEFSPPLAGTPGGRGRGRSRGGRRPMQQESVPGVLADEERPRRGGSPPEEEGEEDEVWPEASQQMLLSHFVGDQ